MLLYWIKCMTCIWHPVLILFVKLGLFHDISRIDFRRKSLHSLNFVKPELCERCNWDENIVMYWKRYQQHIITKLCPVANVVTNIKSRYTLKNTWQQIITKLNTLVNFVSYLRTQMHWKTHYNIGAKPNLYCEAINLVCGGAPKLCALVEWKALDRVKSEQ